MYCPHCNTDVAASLDEDGQTVRCAHCHSTIATHQRASLATDSSATQEAHSLLQRWADPALFRAEVTKTKEIKNENDVAEDIIDANQIEDALKASSEISDSTKAKQKVLTADSIPDSTTPDSTANLKPNRARDFHVAHELKEPVSIKSLADLDALQKRLSETVESMENQSRLQQQNASAIQPPKGSVTSFEVQQAIQEQQKSRFNWKRFLGLMFSYLGVASLSIGGGGVAWSFLGGPETLFLPGCLLVFVGQLVFFLGLVTMISTGVSELKSDVTSRVDFIRSLLARLDAPASLPQPKSLSSFEEAKAETSEETDFGKRETVSQLLSDSPLSDKSEVVEN